MSESFTGLITKVRKDRKGFFIDGNWYSVFASSEMDGVNKGDTVTFTFTKKGDWNNIDNGTVKVTAGATASGSGSGGGGGGGGSGSYNSQFRSVPELNRIDGLRFAVETIGASSTAGDVKEAVQATLKLANLYTLFIDGSLPAAGAASTPASTGGGADAAAKAAAEAAAAEEAEAARVAAEAAAQAQQAAGASALDDFLGG
jgi:hypothetical protein